MSDAVTLVYCLGYGLFMGSYPVPIKSRAVLAADVHPVVFQLYKSFWVCATGLCFAVPTLLRGEPLRLSGWAVAAACVWIPCGLCTIYAVPRIGLSLTIVLAAASWSVGSFLVFWLVLGEEVRTHELLGMHGVYLAPLYLASAVGGMTALIYAPKLRPCCEMRDGRPLLTADGAKSAGDISLGARLPSGRPTFNGCVASATRGEEEAPRRSGGGSGIGSDGGSGGGSCGVGGRSGRSDGAASGSSPSPPPRRAPMGSPLGLAAALASGVFATIQYGLVNVARRFERRRAGCADGGCPEWLEAQFDPLGLWTAAFGLGAAAATALLYAALVCGYRVAGRPAPALQLRVMRLPGTVAGLAWSAANLCATLAVSRGGNSVTTAQMLSVQLITTGVWGIAYYREVRGWRLGAWLAAAIWTLASIALLGFERV